ncbi:hypothetical protein BCR35DRAFT_309591 [Leucosporidium creatinivorum]|uniref:ARID domain-containing protein n=1 Tax=Leucosporidium creatinivorum TaxID=106004 RepID=A0A1Y2DF11_9BASI|nr:hypothetical protein BCR35DRAFT_309591 [Leucosporidium creatinivorum]
MQNSNSQWAAAHGGGESWHWSDLGSATAAGGGTSVSAGMAAAAAFDAQYSNSPQPLGARPSTQTNPPTPGFGAQQPGVQATLGDMNVMYDLLGQGALQQSQFDLLMGGGLGQEGLAGSLGGGYPQGAGVGEVQMRNSMLPYSSAPPQVGAYPPYNAVASSSAPNSFGYGAPSASQPPMLHQQLPNNVYSHSSWSPHPPPQQQHPPHQPPPPKPLPPHPAFQAYPSPPISAQIPLPGRPTIPPHVLASHVANLDRMSSLQNQMSEREAILGAGQRGRDPAIMAQLQSQLHILKAQHAPLMAQCQSFVHANGGHEIVGAEVHAYKMQQGGGGSVSRPSSQMQSRPPPSAPSYASSAPPPASATLPFSLPQSANARAFNNLPVTSAPPAPSPAPTFQPTYPSAAAPPQPHDLPSLPNLQPGAQTHTPPPTSSQPRPHPQPPQAFPQQPQQPPRPRPPPIARNSSDSLPPGLRAQMAAARRAQSTQPPPTPATPSVAMGNLNSNTPIMPMAVAPGLGGRTGTNDGSPGSRPLAPLPKARDLRSATAILADPAPGMPTLAQLQSQLSHEKFNSILPVVLGKQGIPLAARYTVGQGAFPVDLFQLYQTVMVTGHGGEKVSAESRWPSIAASLALPASDRDTVPQELGDLYKKVLMPFETVWSTALLDQRNQASAEKSRQKALNDSLESNGGGAPPATSGPPSTSGTPSSSGGAGFAPSHPGGAGGDARPPQYHASQFEIPRADPNDPKSAFRFGGVDFTLNPDTAVPLDMTNTTLHELRQKQEQERRPTAEAHEKIRASARAGGQIAPFTPPGPSASPSSWVGGAASAPGSVGSSLSRRSSTMTGTGDSGRFEELLDVGGDGEDGEGRRRKRTKSGEATMGGDSAFASSTSAAAVNFTLPTFPSTSSSTTFSDSTAPAALPPLPPSLSLPTNDDLFPQYLFGDSTGGSPPSTSISKSPDLLLTGVGPGDEDTPSSSIDLSGLGMGMGLGDWDTGASSGDLSAELSKWDAGTGLSDAAFNFEEELASWTAAGPGGGL